MTKSYTYVTVPYNTLHAILTAPLLFFHIVSWLHTNIKHCTNIETHEK